MNLQHILNEHSKWHRGEGGERAKLWDADLLDADLHHADLRCANLRHADLSDANLSGADLSGADLSGANLHHTNLSGANLSDTTGNMCEVRSLQLEQYPITYTASRLQIGCENYPIEQWWEFSEDEIFDMDGQEAIVFWYKYKNHIQSTIKLSPAVKP